MFQSFTNKFKCTLGDKLDISEIIDFFTSEDIENMPPNSQLWFPMNFTSGVFSSETLVYKIYYFLALVYQILSALFDSKLHFMF